MLFFASLVIGQDPIVIYDQGKLVQTRKIDLGIHINGFWNEAINPAEMRKSLGIKIKKTLASRCVDFIENPQYYEIPSNEDELIRKYKNLNMNYQFDFRLDQICP